MRLTVCNCIRRTGGWLSNKTGFGPYRLHRKGVFFVGTEPHVLKYHLVGLEDFSFSSHSLLFISPFFFNYGGYLSIESFNCVVLHDVIVCDQFCTFFLEHDFTFRKLAFVTHVSCVTNISLLQLQDKKPSHNYGLQGTNHLLPGKGRVAGNLPTKVLMKKDKIYPWCACGYSGNQVQFYVSCSFQAFFTLLLFNFLACIIRFLVFIVRKPLEFNLLTLFPIF